MLFATKNNSKKNAHLFALAHEMTSICQHWTFHIACSHLVHGNHNTREQRNKRMKETTYKPICSIIDKK